MFSLSYLSLSLVLAAVCFIGFVGAAVKRLYFHPLKNVPGPRLAAATGLYELYYDCILHGQFHFKIKEMHKRYGPIVRINPREVHIDDPHYFDKLYNVTGRFDKDIWFYRFLNMPEGAFGTKTAELHRLRRKPMNKFFSPAAINNFSKLISANIEKLCERYEEFKEAEKPVSISNSYRCLVTDNVTDYCLPHGYNMLEEDDFASDYNKQARTFTVLALWHRQFPFIIPMFMKTPRWVVKYTAPPGSLESFDFQTGIIKQATEVALSDKRSDETVVHGIMNSDLPPHEKTPSRVQQDARTLVGAGSETTATTLEVITFYLLSNPDMKKRLKEELAPVAEAGQLENYDYLKRLPYLSAVVKEGLRRAFSVSGRMPRIDPKNTIVYEGHALPPGTPISMSIPFVHLNEEVYPDPLKFDPERFIREGEKERSEAYLVPFGGGSRICIGKEFATVTLYLATAMLFHKYDMELHDSSERDISFAHEMFAPFPPEDSKGVWVTFK